MATISSVFNVTSPSEFAVGERYSWTVLHITGLTTIITRVEAVDTVARTITLSYDDALLPDAVDELTDCNITDPILIADSCCTITYYDAADTDALGDLAALGIPCGEGNLPVGDNLIRVGSNPQLPEEIWRYNGTGDACVLSNWTRVETTAFSIGDNWGSQVVQSDGSLNGAGTAGSLLVVNPFQVSSGDSPTNQATGPNPVSPTENLHFYSVGGISVSQTTGSGAVRVAIEPANITDNFTASGAPVSNPADQTRPSIHFALDGIYFWDTNALAWVKIVNSDVVIEAQETYNPANLGDGSGTVPKTITVTGAALGDFAQASFSLDTQGVQLHAWVSDADTVSYRFQNETGGAVDLDEGTVNIRVTKV